MTKRKTPTTRRKRHDPPRCPVCIDYLKRREDGSLYCRHNCNPALARPGRRGAALSRRIAQRVAEARKMPTKRELDAGAARAMEHEQRAVGTGIR